MTNDKTMTTSTLTPTADPDAAPHTPWRIAVVDDVAIIRAVFRSIAEDFPGMELVWLASDLKEAKEALAKDMPDLLVLDVNLPDGDGFDFAKDLVKSHPELPVLIFSAHEGSSYVEKAMECGAKGFLGKNVPPQKVIEAISIICTGGTCLDGY